MDPEWEGVSGCVLLAKDQKPACPSSGFCTEYEIMVISVWGKGEELRVILSEHR